MEDRRMRIVAWNIRAGGGRRIERVAGHLDEWQPDLAVLSEFRGTPASRWLAADLADRGLSCQLTTVSETLPVRNGLLVASRWPVVIPEYAPDCSDAHVRAVVGKLAPPS
jgi:hypothetical protein